MNIAAAIKKIVEQDGNHAMIAKVDSVDAQERTCVVSPVGGQAQLTARLQAKIGGSKGWVIIPAVGSDVVVTMINDETGFVAACSDIGSVSLANNTADLSEQLEKLINIIDATLNQMLVIKVITPAGPSTGLLPDNIVAIGQERAKLAQVKTALQTLIK